MCEEDKKIQLLEWLKKQKRVSTKTTHEYINRELFADERDTLLVEKHGLRLPVSSSTVHSWMIKLGCNFDRAKQSYYTDAHERSDVKEYRRVYIDRRRFYQLRQPCWVQMKWHSLSPEQQEKLTSLTEEGEDALSAEVHRFHWDGDELVEFHVDFLGGESNEEYDKLRKRLGNEGGSYTVRFDKASRMECKFSHDPAICKCHQKLHHMGPGESIYKAYAREGKEWVIRGVRGLRKKTAGPGEMISAFQDEYRGFGLVLSEEELAMVNNFRQTKSRPPLESSPGLRFTANTGRGPGDMTSSRSRSWMSWTAMMRCTQNTS